jgi:hypothetical protein
VTEVRAEPAARFAAAHKWLETPFGQALLAQEARVVEEAFDGIFGEQCLQLGLWGEPNTFLRFARTQRSALIADPANITGSDKPGAADRVLHPHGHLVVLGFKPGGLWGFRRLIPGAGLPPAADKLISDRQLSDWLKLLDMRIHGVTRYFFRWPLPGNKGNSNPKWESRGRRFWPELAACYMLTAQKRVFTLTPVKKPWRARPKVVGGIVEPTTRVSRIHFDRND